MARLPGPLISLTGGVIRCHADRFACKVVSEARGFDAVQSRDFALVATFSAFFGSLFLPSLAPFVEIADVLARLS